ncbi:MAG TPA: DNA/RNA non-specific endonuclease, partial [Bacteroidales bacterium]|nr:DNA/RNA non-specific endonuclease [Bacteroidales bacterium]
MRKVYFLAYLLLVSQFVIAQNYAMPLITSKDIILSHKGFVINYDKSTKNARWVAYTLIGDKLQTKIKRKNNFMSDPLYPQSASNNDFVKSGFDKGHLFPAGS